MLSFMKDPLKQKVKIEVSKKQKIHHFFEYSERDTKHDFYNKCGFNIDTEVDLLMMIGIIAGLVFLLRFH